MIFVNGKSTFIKKLLFLSMNTITVQTKYLYLHVYSLYSFMYTIISNTGLFLSQIYKINSNLNKVTQYIHQN